VFSSGLDVSGGYFLIVMLLLWSYEVAKVVLLFVY
jgi:hypothetical protein